MNDLIPVILAEPVEELDEATFQAICEQVEQEIVRLENINYCDPAAAALQSELGDFIVAYRRSTGEI